ncbi:MAG: PspC domain-containing protein [Anaerolineae bacterium]|jgi:phage shock protein C|nr:PspC domain-containing protein [Anaerolineae bacterium]
MKSQRLTRSLTDRVLGGVCGGLGAVIGINPWWVRGAVVILGLFTAGTGVLIYLALWLVLPAQTLDDIEDDPDSARWRAPRPETLILIGGAVIVMGIIVLARNLGALSGTNGDAFLPLVVIVFGLTLLVKQLRRTA